MLLYYGNSIEKALQVRKMSIGLDWSQVLEQKLDILPSFKSNFSKDNVITKSFINTRNQEAIHQ